MALQFSVAVRNARLDAVETATGASPTIEFRTGAPPANAAAADSGTLIGSATLPSDFMAAAASGAKALAGSWTVTASASGTVGHFRIKQSTTCHQQGTCTVSGGGGDMIVQNTSVNSGQQISITGYTITDGNA
jgi:hypothetical protein